MALDDAGWLDASELELVRRFGAHRGQRHLSGWYACASTNQLIAYESRLECSALRLLDFEGEARAIASQPFQLSFPGSARADHVPDYFIALRDGRSVVLDVSPARSAQDPRRERAFRSTRRACDGVGWLYRLETELPETLAKNLESLAGFRYPPPTLETWKASVLEACDAPRSIDDILALTEKPTLVKPVLLHLIWTKQLVVDMNRPLTGRTQVAAAPRGAEHA